MENKTFGRCVVHDGVCVLLFALVRVDEEGGSGDATLDVCGGVERMSGDDVFDCANRVSDIHRRVARYSGQMDVCVWVDSVR